MFLKSPKRTRLSLALRLTIWYAASFVVISLALSIISYVYLSSAVRDNRRVIEAKLDEIAAVARERGIDAIAGYVGDKHPVNHRHAFFIRVLSDQGRVIFSAYPGYWRNFETALRTLPVAGAWQYAASSKDGDVLELASAQLLEGFLLQVGKMIQDRNEILEHYRETIIGVIFGMVIIGLAGGAFLAFRALRPVRDLAQITQSIIATGNVNARVPESGRGDELDDLTQLFNQMLGRIEALITGMKGALDNVAHDLRTPLTRLRGMAEVTLESSPDSEQYREALANGIEECDRMLSQLNSLMDISEAETGTMRLKLEKLNLSGLLAEVAELYQYVADEKHVSISVNGSPDMVITGDRSRIRQVFANLLDNAIKYNSAGGRVIIRARQDLTRTIVTFEDTGAGIPTEDLGKIWDRLYRGDQSRSQPGLGLGLSLVKAVVHAHHGRIEVQNAPGQGAVFTLSLPLSPLLNGDASNLSKL
jgi:heavy metal sensor kinase